MSDQIIISDLLVELSTEEQQLLSGGYGYYGGGYGRPYYGRPYYGRPYYGRPYC